MHLQCDLFCKMSFVLFVVTGSLPQNPINHTKFSGRPYFGGGWGVGGGGGENYYGGNVDL